MVESFIFYRSFCDETELLSDEDYGKLMKAVHKYGIHDIEPDNLSPMLMMAFGLMKPQIDANNRKRNKGKTNGTKGAEYGKLGGRPKKEKPLGGFEENPQGVIEEIKENPQGVIEKPPNVNDNVNDNENEKERDPPPEKDITARVESLRQFWEKCKLPPAQIITNPIILDSVKDSLKTFSDEKIAKSISNYAELVNRPGFDESVLPGGKRTNFQNFLKRWIDRFTEEAEPFKNFRQTGPPKDGFDISTPKEEL